MYLNKKAFILLFVYDLVFGRFLYLILDLVLAFVFDSSKITCILKWTLDWYFCDWSLKQQQKTQELSVHDLRFCFIHLIPPKKSKTIYPIDDYWLWKIFFMKRLCIYSPVLIHICPNVWLIWPPKHLIPIISITINNNGILKICCLE